MRIFKMMKIRTKLAALICVMVLGLLSIGVTGFYDIMKSNRALDNIYSRNMIAVEKLSDARTQSRGNFANILNLMVTETSEDKQIILDDYESRLEKMNTDYSDFLKLELNQYEKDQYKLIQTNMEEWTTIANKIMEDVALDNQDAAIKLFKDSGEAAFEKLQTSIRDLVNFNMNEADDIFNDHKSSGEAAATQLILILVVATALCIVLATLISLSITNPINRIVTILRKTSNLDFSHDESYSTLRKYKGEIGTIAKALSDLRKELRNSTGNILSISNNLAASSEELAATTEENVRAINQVVVAVNEIAQGNNTQAEMVENTSETVKEMVSRIEEVNMATLETSKNAKESIVMVEEGQKAIDVTVEKIKLNRKVTADVGNAIDELSKQMDKVGSIISVINDISKQTNLLSLNASIEAARTGEAGKGFAVVASEIGSLASETATAVREITQIIQDAIDKNAITANNNEIAKNISIEQEKAIEIMKEAFDHIKLSVQDITGRTMNVAEQMNYINDSSRKISDQTHDISATAQESAASSEEISASNEEQLASSEMIAASANDLSTIATDLNAEISKFKV